MNKSQLIVCLALATLVLGTERHIVGQQIQSNGLLLPSRNANREKPATRFLRLIKDENGQPASLETSITRYRSSDGKLLVDLIGVIHVGERNYYRKLNHQFEQYESLLYELVAPPESRIPNRAAARQSSNPIHWLQNSMQQMLGLQSQLQHIDYKKSNFVHADLSPTQIQQKMAERGETMWSVGLSAINEMMQQSRHSGNNAAPLGSGISDLEDLFETISNPLKLKRMMATQFASGDLNAGLGSTLNQLLITDRNQAAMKVLKKEINGGKTQIGIFYGAAHMPDFEHRLTTELGMKKTKQAWVQAWNLESTSSVPTPASGFSEMFLQLMKALDDQ